MPDADTRPERLFIKLILPKQGKEHKVAGGGGPLRPFRSVTPQFRATLSSQVRAIERTIRPLTQRTGGAPIRVRLLPKAFAKSHRPKHLFSEQTCPIIGAGKLGELFLKATPSGLEALDRFVRTAASPTVPEVAIGLAVEAAVAATTTAGIHGSRANRAGSFFEHNAPGEVRGRAHRQRAENRGYVCQEADQHLQSARRNRHGNRDNGTRQSAGTSEKKRSLWKAAWMRWPNCANMLLRRRRYSMLVRRKRTLRRSPRPMAAAASDA
jgi:hypothetical protein